MFIYVMVGLLLLLLVIGFSRRGNKSRSRTNSDYFASPTYTDSSSSWRNDDQGDRGDWQDDDKHKHHDGDNNDYDSSHNSSDSSGDSGGDGGGGGGE